MIEWVPVGLCLFGLIIAAILVAEIARIIILNWIRDWRQWRTGRRERRLQRERAAEADRRAKESYVKWVSNDMRHPSKL